jgi:hypothetical protein
VNQRRCGRREARRNKENGGPSNCLIFFKAERIGERHSINRELIKTVKKRGMNKPRRERLN